MKGKKNAPTGHININSEVLAELFPSDDSPVVHSFSESDLAAIGRIISYATVLGGLVTFYRSSTERSLCLSLRLGERKRALLLNGDDIDATFLEQLSNGLARAWLEAEQLRNANQLADEQGKTKKKK